MIQYFELITKGCNLASTKQQNNDTLNPHRQDFGDSRNSRNTCTISRMVGSVDKV